MGYDDQVDIKKATHWIVITLVIVWLSQMTVLILKLCKIINWSWIWVFSITWVSLGFWFVVVGGIMIFDWLGADKQ